MAGVKWFGVGRSIASAGCGGVAFLRQTLWQAAGLLHRATPPLLTVAQVWRLPSKILMSKILIDSIRGVFYTGAMRLRRLIAMVSLSAYIGVGFGRQACAVERASSSAAETLAVSRTEHDCCRGEDSSSAVRARRTDNCCVAHLGDGSVLLPGEAALPSMPSRMIAFVAANPIPAADAAGAVRLAPRAPPGLATALLPEALHGPRPPPSRPVVL